MIGRRLVTVAVLLPLLLVCLWLGSWAWLALVAAIMAIAVSELVALLGRSGLNATRTWAWAAAALALAPAAFSAHGFAPAGALAAGPLFALLLSFTAFLLAPGDRPYADFLAVVGAALYPAWLLAFLIVLRSGTDGLGTTFWLLAVVWVGDAAAFGGGKVIGGAHIVPGISPGKTLGGFVAGLLVSLAAAVALAPLVGLARPTALALGLVVAVAAQFGDLVESLLKRRAGVKDSGAILPGHGGMLDRFDGVLVAAPVLYYCLTLLRP